MLPSELSYLSKPGNQRTRKTPAQRLSGVGRGCPNFGSERTVELFCGKLLLHSLAPYRVLEVYSKDAPLEHPALVLGKKDYADFVAFIRRYPKTITFFQYLLNLVQWQDATRVSLKNHPLRWLPRVFTNNASYQAYVTERNLVTLSLRFCSRDSPLRLPIQEGSFRKCHFLDQGRCHGNIASFDRQ